MLTLERFDDVPAMLDASSEDQHALAVLRLLDNLGAGGADQIVLIHQVFGLAGNKLAAPHMQAGCVGFDDAGLGAQRAQIAVADQFLNTNLVADGIEEVVRLADHPAGHPKWRSRQSNHPQVWIDHLRLGEELAVHAVALGRDHMGFVYQDQIETIQFACPSVDRLDARDDHRVLRIPAPQAGRIDTDVQLRRHA